MEFEEISIQVNGDFRNNKEIFEMKIINELASTIINRNREKSVEAFVVTQRTKRSSS